MVFALFRRSGNRRVIERLYADVVVAARTEIFYRDYGVADSVDGRFEMLVLHAALAVRRLRALPSPGPDMAQDLTDIVFKHFDSMLREAGIGDTSVPKRMKKLAEAFYGRAAAYETAIADDDHGDLADALARNVLADAANRAGSDRLARYAEAAVAQFDALSVMDFVDGQTVFPDPASIV